ncbi:MAG: hypothetical protein HYV07_22975 [Deltaproteobacteria bacterium]|nr:hypothetical protein [Deltaproteobacteria bacterium]
MPCARQTPAPVRATRRTRGHFRELSFSGANTLPAEDIVRVLVARGVVLEESARIRVLACRDLALLDRWFDQALTLAPSAVDPNA